MKVFISNKEIEEIASGLIQAACGSLASGPIDIDGIARFLGLQVQYEHIAEDELDKIGFVSNGSYSLSVLRQNQRVGIVFPKDTIILDSFLQRPVENCRRRFVLAHEISHILINRADPLHNPACFDREYDSDRQYSLQELQERLNLGECQANAMATMLLMPMPLLQNTLRRHLHRSRLPIYGESVLLPSTKPAIHAMADELGVSFSALLIQLKKYKLVDHREITEYFQKMRESL